MIRKLSIVVVSVLAVIGLSGCGGGGGDTVIADNGPVPETYFMTDGYGNGVSGIIYQCDSGFAGVTDFNLVGNNSPTFGSIHIAVGDNLS